MSSSIISGVSGTSSSLACEIQRMNKTVKMNMKKGHNTRLSGTSRTKIEIE